MYWLLKIQKKKKKEKNRKESHKPENKGPNIVNVSTSSKKMMYGSKVFAEKLSKFDTVAQKKESRKVIHFGVK